MVKNENRVQPFLVGNKQLVFCGGRVFNSIFGFSLSLLIPSIFIVFINCLKSQASTAIDSPKTLKDLSKDVEDLKKNVKWFQEQSNKNYKIIRDFTKPNLGTLQHDTEAEEFRKKIEVVAQKTYENSIKDLTGSIEKLQDQVNQLNTNILQQNKIIIILNYRLNILEKQISEKVSTALNIGGQFYYDQSIKYLQGLEKRFEEKDNFYVISLEKLQKENDLLQEKNKEFELRFNQLEAKKFGISLQQLQRTFHRARASFRETFQNEETKDKMTMGTVCTVMGILLFCTWYFEILSKIQSASKPAYYFFKELVHEFRSASI